MGYPGAAANLFVGGDGKSQFGKPTGTACFGSDGIRHAASFTLLMGNRWQVIVKVSCKAGCRGRVGEELEAGQSNMSRLRM